MKNIVGKLEILKTNFDKNNENIYFKKALAFALRGLEDRGFGFTQPWNVKWKYSVKSIWNWTMTRRGWGVSPHKRRLRTWNHFWKKWWTVSKRQCLLQIQKGLKLSALLNQSWNLPNWVFGDRALHERDYFC